MFPSGGANTFGDFQHNYPEIITLVQLQPNNNYSSSPPRPPKNSFGNHPEEFTINNHYKLSSTNEVEDHVFNFHHDDRTTRSIDLIRNIPFSDESQQSTSISSNNYFVQSLESSVFCFEENYLDDYRVETEEYSNSFTTTTTSSSNNQYYFTSPALSSVDSSTSTTISMPVKSNSSVQSFEDSSILSCGEEAWVCLLFRGGLRMIDSESRDWIFEQVDFNFQTNANQCTNCNNHKCSMSPTLSQLEKVNISVNLKNLNDNIECKYTTNVNNNTKFAKSVGCVHYYKPDQPFTMKTSKLRKGLIDVVSSENFGMASLFVCPPLILAHWYAVYQKKSIELNSAKYIESEWVFNNREQCLERVAVLKSYPKVIQNNLKHYSKQELNAYFPEKIVCKSIAYDYVRRNGFSFAKVDSKCGATTFNLRCGSETMIEFISSFEYCTNLLKMFTLISVSLISRTMPISVLCKKPKSVNEETDPFENNALKLSPDGEAILYNTKLQSA